MASLYNYKDCVNYQLALWWGLLVSNLLLPVVAQAQVPDTVASPAPFIVGAYAQGSIILAHTYAIKHLVASHHRI